MKAMILAAGRGERLRPLTDRLPKPLVEVGGKPLIAWHLERLAAAGCREAVINVSHLGEQIDERSATARRYGLRIAYSREAEPLETAGGIAQALPLLGREPFLLVNADIYCEIDFRAAARASTLGGELAPSRAGAQSGASRRKATSRSTAGAIGNDRPPRYTYAGIAVMSPRLVAPVQRGTRRRSRRCCAAAADAAHQRRALRGLWQDVGTAERLAELEKPTGNRDMKRR